MSDLFDSIYSPDKIKLLAKSQLNDFATYLRAWLIDKISIHGGHFAANLGTIELTIALHYFYNCPKDILVWDVGHQSYAHKVLTHRKQSFDTLRKFNGLSGFPKIEESEYDAFGTGHSSTSISAVLGYAVAARLQKINRQHIAIIGDGALSAGQAFEALNNAAVSNTNITIIVNDNHIGIDPSQGAIGEHLENISPTNNIFTSLGFQYWCVNDGHDINELINTFESISQIEKPKIVHIKTIKGKGYPPAEKEQTKWHSTAQFDKWTGLSNQVANVGVKYQDVFGKTLLHLAKSNPRIVAVTPAMISGSSLHYLQEVFPDRVFDVGIAEQHAVTFSGGLAKSGLLPFCCIYSTFLQRGYDQFIHDIALQNLPVIFAIDRAGLVGEDGPTHHGTFDIGFLQNIPNVTIVSPRNAPELVAAMHTAVNIKQGVFAIRYPRGYASGDFTEVQHTLPIGKAEKLCGGNDLCIISHGVIAENCQKAINLLGSGNIAHYDFKFLKPLDSDTLQHIFKSFNKILIVEEGQSIGGIAATIAQMAFQYNYTGLLKNIAIADTFVPHGSIAELQHWAGLDTVKILNTLKNCLSL